MSVAVFVCILYVTFHLEVSRDTGSLHQWSLESLHLGHVDSVVLLSFVRI